MLPPGQKARNDFPRFGLPTYVERFPSNVDDQTLVLALEGEELAVIDLSSSNWSRVTNQSDFHCVTTWSYLGATWGGVKLGDIYKKYIQSLENPSQPIAGAVLYAQDGYKTSLRLEDLLGSDVMLATTLDEEPLPIEHGAPVRLVAPDHYGYKNVKHVTKIDFYREMPIIKRGLRAFLDHPRGRVKKEERGRWVPGWILRYLYRPLIGGTVKDFRNAMREYRADDS